MTFPNTHIIMVTNLKATKNIRTLLETEKNVVLLVILKLRYLRVPVNDAKYSSVTTQFQILHTPICVERQIRSVMVLSFRKAKLC